MISAFRYILLGLLFYCMSGNIHISAQAVQTDNAVVELISEQITIQPGQPFWIGIKMDIRENWYVYYRNPGDSGMPMMVEWLHEEDVNIGEIQWPTPKWMDVSGGLTSYGYKEQILYIMEAIAPAHLSPGEEYTLLAEADWLICEDVCIPEYADLELTLLVTDGDVEYNEEWLPLFAETRENLPVTLDYWEATAEFEGNTATLTLTNKAFDIPGYSEIRYFAKKEGEIENGAPQPFSVDGNTITMQLHKSTYKSGDIDRLWGLIYSPEGWDDSGNIRSMVVDVSLGDASIITGNISSMPVFSAGFLLILAFAFIGGLILNLMPCVFPILSIKVMNFMQMAGHQPRMVKLHGLVFGLGVLLTFLALAGLLLALRAGGQELGWGFQLQTPAFIAFMTFLMFGLGLSLMGVFEIGNSLINVAGKANTGSGMRGSFFSGILATVLATPCTAPFMGTALGVAITLPAATALLIFAFLGFGMAAPYVLLSSFPVLMKYMPKPGAWMETFKQILAFPLFATAIWLIWVFGQQTGVNGLTRLLIGLLLLSMGIWILYRWKAIEISTGTRIVSRGFVTLFILAGFMFSAASQPVTIQNEAGISVSYGIEWQDFSNDLVNQHRADGKNVFIDFTADWCITCKANERVVFSSNRVKDRFEELGFEMVKADWTNRNPEITQALASFGRNGVPLYVIYSSELDEPMILPELLTPGIVLNALDQFIPAQDITQADI
ncbi:MAG: thiol:disulfide interchange protein [Balneolaceae bacterium]|nr:MAG: thiol:disulfide interchange protein [Balneolaceae bacterium]